MDKSTPISHLRRGDDDDDGGAALESMVNDVENDPRGQPMPGYEAGDEDQDYDPRDPRDPRNHRPQGPPSQHCFPPQRGGPPPGHPGHPGYGMPPHGNPHGNPRGLENMPMSQKIMMEAKEPLLVAVLVIILSSGQVTSLISRFLPMANANPLIGLIVRALLAGAAFYLLRRFIPS